MSKREDILSQDYMEFLYPGFDPDEEIIKEYAGSFYQPLSSVMSTVYVNIKDAKPLNFSNYAYSSIPKIYGLMDDIAFKEAGITDVITQPVLSLDGEDIIIAIADTGVDIFNPVFRDEDNNSRILKLWDQSDNSGRLPTTLQEAGVAGNLLLELEYGSELDAKEIDELILNNTKSTIGADTNSHGTFLASLMAMGAPNAKFIIVKLKEAKDYLKSYYNVSKDVLCYAENDIIAALNYIKTYSNIFKKPVSVLLALGTNQGDHKGNSYLSEEINFFRSKYGGAVVCAAGNEGDARHHFRGNIDEENNFKEEMEIRIGENVRGFSFEVWTEAPKIFSIGFISPTGEVIEKIQARLGASQVIELIFEKTRIFVDYEIVENASGAELIFVRFDDPTYGVWKVILYGDSDNQGEFDAWLPLSEFGNSENFFLKPDPLLTVCEPATAQNAIATGAYDMLTNIFYIASGRGDISRNIIKPDIIAPGVRVLSYDLQQDLIRRTGTSIAAAITAAGVADLLQWLSIREKEKVFTSKSIKSYLIRGAIRDNEQRYPNNETGYGKVNIYNTLEQLR